jgi:hypothetical protein
MTPAGAPTVFVIDWPDLVRVRSEHINGMIGLEVNHSRVTGN